jgi:hypothetical protein
MSTLLLMSHMLVNKEPALSCQKVTIYSMCMIQNISANVPKDHAHGPQHLCKCAQTSWL